jgi:hypothetical protein
MQMQMQLPNASNLLSDQAGKESPNRNLLDYMAAFRCPIHYCLSAGAISASFSQQTNGVPTVCCHSARWAGCINLELVTKSPTVRSPC